MTKYYRVRSQEQWDWLKNKLEIEDDSHVSNFPVTILYGDVICGIYKYHDDPEPLIEVSQMMEDEKMENEDYVTIKCEDLEKVHWETNYGRVSFINHDENGEKYAHEQYLPANLIIHESLVQQKVKMTQAEKDEFDTLNKEWTTLSLAISAINDEFLKYPLLHNQLFGRMTSAEKNEAQIEFARAWADPSLIEVIPEKRWNVKVPPFERTNKYYYKYGEELDWSISSDNENEDQQFTDSELKEYGLDDDMYEKVEVTDDGTK